MTTALAAPVVELPDLHSQGHALPPGHRIRQYELIRRLGRGGMGAVYLARDLRLGRLVAIKVLLEARGDLGGRFLVEARTTARCNHENIVVIHEVGDDDDQPYMVLEYLEGQTLSAWLSEHGVDESAPVAPRRAIDLMLPVVRALDYAHERGIVHRDLKPANVMLTEAGTIKVLDFGIAKVLSDRDDARHDERGPAQVLHAPGVTSGVLIGTLPYMSPEQMNVADVDHRSDLWAVGIMLFEMIVGRHPLHSLDPMNLLKVADEDLPMPSVQELAPDLGPLAGIIDRCLIKDRDRRTSGARVLLEELEALASERRSRGHDEHGTGNPFAGLAAFQEADAGRFFGRDSDVQGAVTRLRSQPLVAVVGPSGTGKSSFIRAGVIPTLKRSGEGWDAYVVRPGRQPLTALANVLVHLQSTTGNRSHSAPLDRSDSTGLSDSSGVALPSRLIERLSNEPGYLGARLRERAAERLRRIVLFVDQFEELYTQGVASAERNAFLASLAGVADDAASPLRVILAMRSDFLDRLTADRHLTAEVTRGLLLLPPMGREGLRQALVRPLDAVDVRFESEALVDRMIDALDGTPGALPLLQFTAATLWEQRDLSHRLITEASYDATGGVAGALASHADAVMAAMPKARQALARQVFERLVTPERTRALVGLDELYELHGAPGEVDELVRHLVAMRLIVVESDAEGKRAAELVHESLLEAWPTLQRWLNENQDDAAFLDRLRRAARSWEQHGRDEGLLWRGAPEREARLWYERYRGGLPAREQAFVDAAFALASRAERRRRRIISASMAGMAGLLIAAGLVIVTITRTQSERDEHAQRATQEAAKALAQAALAEERLSKLEQAESQLRATLNQEQRLRGEAEAAQLQAEAAQRHAEAAQREAEEARANAEEEADRAREALARARASDARAEEASVQARTQRQRARDASEAEQRAREEKRELIDRSLGPVRRTLPDQAP
ncbi:serine/threonine-protein kinase [Haliangium sp.]|uniref:serine/threonine-protein kinase n=1 Tax=Haliangium sp. TaxID=2663208 RepID=UPI003D14AF6E